MAQTTLAARFLSTALAARPYDGSNLQPDSVRQLLARYRRAIPVAQTIVRFDSPLNLDADALEAFSSAEQKRDARAAKRNGDTYDECASDTTDGEVRHVMALAMGLMIAESWFGDAISMHSARRNAAGRQQSRSERSPRRRGRITKVAGAATSVERR